MTSFLRISEKNWLLRLTGMFYFFLRKTLCSLFFFVCVGSKLKEQYDAATCFCLSYSYLTANFLILTM